MSDVAISTADLNKVFTSTDFWKKGTVGLEGLNLEVQQGEVYAFLGPNGAGKTTTIKLLTRLLLPTRGEIYLFGRRNTSPAAMAGVGYLPEQPSLYGYLTGVEFLDFIARLFGIGRSKREKRISNLLRRVGLEGRGSNAIRGYSRGMIQRLGLAQALINDPKLIILDEPMASLDPIGRKDFRDMILSLKEEGRTIFFSSHILSDAEMIADRAGILNRGRLVNTGKLDDLVQSQSTVVEVTFLLDRDKQSTIQLDAGAVVQDQKILVRLKPDEDIRAYLRKIDGWGGQVVSVVPQKKSLEDLFLDQVGR